MRQLLICVLASMAASGLPSMQAMAGTFSISPVRVDLETKAATGVVTIRNQEDQPVVIQADARLWQQSNGVDELTPTRDVLVTPAVFTIPPKGAQVVRLALRRAADPVLELNYRLILSEVPQQAKPGFTGLNLALQMSLPIFVAARVPTKPDLQWSAARDGDGSLVVKTRNAGTAHARVFDLKIGPVAADGADIEQQAAVYVLPGQYRTWTLAADDNNKQNDSARWRQLRVKGTTEDGDFAAESRQRRTRISRAHRPDARSRACARRWPRPCGERPARLRGIRRRIHDQRPGATDHPGRSAGCRRYRPPRADNLATLRLKQPARGALEIHGERYYRLDAELGARVTFDPSAQHADVELPPDAFQATRTAAVSPDAWRPTSTALGGFLNYDLYGESTSAYTALGGVAEAGVFGRYGVGTNTLLSRDDVDGRALVRLDTTWTLDFPERLATLRVGDAISASGAWGRSVRLGGIQFGTNFATQPTLVTTPMLAAQGTAVVPSTVDVFVNGSKVTSQEVPPGPFTIDHVPAISGAGQMQVVVTDALGRQQVLAQPYYTGPSLLRAGLNEYSFELGSLREGYGYTSGDYGDLMGAATWRRGFSDRFTAEGHLEFQAGGAAALGLDGALQVGDVAIVSATAAVGGQDQMGWLAGVGIEHDGGRLSVFARSQFASEDFEQFGTADFEQRPRQRGFAGVGLDLSRFGSLQFAYGLQTYWTGPRQETVGLSHSLTLGTLGYLNLIVSQSVGSEQATDVFVNWTMPIGERRAAAVSLRHSSEATQDEEFVAVASMQQSLPPGSGIGYQATIASNDEAQLGYAYQGRAGTAGVQYARRNGTDGWRGDVSGGLAITGVGVLPARRLDRSFAVVKVADFPDLTVYVENQPVGRTDSEGRVLLDGLRPYERNEVSIDPRELPMDATLVVPTMEITPAYRSGALAEFPVARARAVTLRLVQDDGSPVPAGASVTTRDGVAPVGFDGLTYIEDAAGVQHAVANWAGKRCEFDFQRPDSTDPVPDLGTIACRNVAP